MINIFNILHFSPCKHASVHLFSFLPGFVLRPPSLRLNRFFFHVAWILPLALVLLPGIVLRLTMHFGVAPDSLRQLVSEAIRSMDGGDFVNGSGVQGPQMHPAALQMTEEDLEQYRRDGYFIVRSAVPVEHLPALRAVFSHIQV